MELYPDGGHLVILPPPNHVGDRHPSEHRKFIDQTKLVLDAILCDGVCPSVDPRWLTEEKVTDPHKELVRVAFRPIGRRVMRRSVYTWRVYSVEENGAMTWIEEPEEGEAPSSWLHPQTLGSMKYLLGRDKVLPHLHGLPMYPLSLVVVAKSVEGHPSLIRHYLAARCRKRRTYVVVGYVRSVGNEKRVVSSSCTTDEGGDATSFLSVSGANDVSLDVESLERVAGGRHGVVTLSPPYSLAKVRCGVIGREDGEAETIRLYELYAYFTSDGNDNNEDPMSPPSLTLASEVTNLEDLRRLFHEYHEEQHQHSNNSGDKICKPFCDAMRPSQHKVVFPARKQVAHEMQRLTVIPPSSSWKIGSVVSTEESQHVEFKAPLQSQRVDVLAQSKLVNWSSVYVCAFANTHGGSLLYGVNDQGIVVGVTLPDVESVRGTFQQGMARIYPTLPRNGVSITTVRTTTSNSGNWWEQSSTEQQATNTPPSAPLALIQVVTCGGVAPFYTCGCHGPAWGRFLASTQVISTAVLLERIDSYLCDTHPI
eukprot:PhF_6_TR37565/c0_g3_i1/m.55663